MKKTIIAGLSVLLTAMAAEAQTLNVRVGDVIYQFPAEQTGEMNYAEGSTLTIMDKTFLLADISSMAVDESDVLDNAVAVEYNGESATVTISGNIAKYVTPTVSGAHVSIEQSADLAEEIQYTLSGTTTDGEFYMSGSYKATIELNGLTLTNATPVFSGAAVNIQNGKRIKVKLVSGTTNTLVDAAGGEQKGCLYIKGHAEFAQKGTLNITGKTKHGIKTGEYMSVKNATINVTSAVGDGISVSEYFLMESGSISISGTQDDGLQCELDGQTSTGETSAHEGEDSGNIYIQGGTITISSSTAAAKGIKATGDIKVAGGSISVTTSGKGLWDTTDRETKAACCMSADGNISILGGDLTLTASGSGGKGMKCDGLLTVEDGTIDVKTTGGLYYSNGSSENTNYSGNTDRIDSKYYSSPKGIKAGAKTTSYTSSAYSGGVIINGGTINVSTSGYNAEGIESKSTLDINGGYVYCNTRDDAINSASTMTITGGYVMAVSSGNDGLDANGNMYVKGGNIFAVAAAQPEVALDANTEGGFSLYITGGNIVAIGGLERGASVSGGTAYQASSFSKGVWYGLYNASSSLAFAYKVPSNSSMGRQMVVYTTGTTSVKSGVTSSGTSFWSSNGSNSCNGGSNVSLSTYNNNGGGGPGGGGFGPGGGGGWW